MLLSSPKDGSEIGLPAVPVPAWLNEQENTQGSLSWLDLAEKAFTSGRIIEPVDDNALYYYHQAVAVNAADTRASSGLERVTNYVIGEAENSIYRGEWSQARQSAQSVIAMLGSHAEAESVLDRVNRFEQVAAYSETVSYTHLTLPTIYSV